MCNPSSTGGRTQQIESIGIHPLVEFFSNGIFLHAYFFLIFNAPFVRIYVRNPNLSRGFGNWIQRLMEEVLPLYFEDLRFEEDEDQQPIWGTITVTVTFFKWSLLPSLNSWDVIISMKGN